MSKKFFYIIFITVMSFTLYLRTVLSVELSKNIIVIMRQGPLEYMPENTLASFRRAVDMGVGGLEIDVRKTKDGKLVLMHDDTIDRTTDGKGHVGNLLYDEIRQYDAGAWNGEAFIGEKVPLLSEVLQFAKENNIKILLNVKEHGIEQLVMSHIEEYGIMEQVYFSGTLKTCRDKDADISGAKLVFLSPEELSHNMIDYIHEKRNHVGTRLIGSDNRDEMEKKMVKGVDVILTDYPDIAIDLLNYEVRSEQRSKGTNTEGKSDIKKSGNDAQVYALTEIMLNEQSDKSRLAALAMSVQPKDITVPILIEFLTYKKKLKPFKPVRKIFSTLTFKKEEKDHSQSATTVRRNAAWGLGMIGDNSAVQPLIRQLTTEDVGFRREIVHALKRIADKQAVPRLNDILLKDKNTYVRYDAAKALGEIKDEDSVYSLIKALENDKKWIVKAGCADALGNIGNKKAINALKAILTTDAGKEASWARDRAAWALSKMGEGAIGVLVTSLEDNEESTRRRASWALIKIGKPVVPSLTSLLRSDKKAVRSRAAFVLGWIGSKNAVHSLSWAIWDKETEVRKMATWALGRIGGAQAGNLLKELLEDQDESVVEYAKEAIQRISL